MPFLELHNGRIHFELSGRDELPVLVLSNSLGASFDMWDPEMPEFTRYFRVLRYDARGHGQSSVTPGPYTIPQLGRDVLDMMDKLKIGRAHFCGLSMGGMIGQALAASSPDRFEKIVLANTAAKIGTPETWDARVDLVRRDGLRSLTPGLIERWFTPAFCARFPETVAATAKMVEATDLDGYIANCAAVRDMDQRESIRSIRVPVLVITGTYDRVTPPSDGRFLAENIPGARYNELDAAHLSNVEASSAFSASVIEFLTSP